MREHHATRLAAAIERNTTITKLDLGGCNIGPEGAARLAAALEINTTVTALNLRYNYNITDNDGVLTRIGALLSGKREEYLHLQRSIAAFPPPAEFAELMRASGLDVLDVALLNHNGHSAVHKAAVKGRRDVCEWLLSSAGGRLGAAHLGADGDGNTPALMARLEGFDALAGWLDEEAARRLRESEDT